MIIVLDVRINHARFVRYGFDLQASVMKRCSLFDYAGGH